jgi:hypothetical protein
VPLLRTALRPADPASQKHHEDLNGIRSDLSVFQDNEHEQVDTLQRDGTDDELLSPAVHLSPRWYNSVNLLKYPVLLFRNTGLA